MVYRLGGFFLHDISGSLHYINKLVSTSSDSSEKSDGIPFGGLFLCEISGSLHYMDKSLSALNDSSERSDGVLFFGLFQCEILGSLHEQLPMLRSAKCWTERVIQGTMYSASY